MTQASEKKVIEGRPMENSAATRLPPRERILQAAGELFYRQGIRAVGVDAIAEAAGTNKMTLYRHFVSKDELVAEYLRELASGKEAFWTGIAIEHPDNPLAQLQAWLRSAAEHVADPRSRGCAFVNAAIELPEKDHPARLVIEQVKRDGRERLTAVCEKAGLDQPASLADELILLLEGALVCCQSLGREGPACHFVGAGEALIKARTR